jgi:hypothetical protein
VQFRQADFNFGLSWCRKQTEAPLHGGPTGQLFGRRPSLWGQDGLMYFLDAILLKIYTQN